MSITLGRLDVLWGKVPRAHLPKLPTGFFYDTISRDKFVFARSKDGRKWFVGRNGLTLCNRTTVWDIVRTNLRWPLFRGFKSRGINFFDQRQTIPFATNETR